MVHATALTQQQAETEVARLRERTQANRRQRLRRSRLARYRAELVALRRAGASYGELQAWLRERRLRVARSTVSRYLAGLTELQDGARAD